MTIDIHRFFAFLCYTLSYYPDQDVIAMMELDTDIRVDPSFLPLIIVLSRSFSGTLAGFSMSSNAVVTCIGAAAPMQVDVAITSRALCEQQTALRSADPARHPPPTPRRRHVPQS
jgi:hypothetical protein